MNQASERADRASLSRGSPLRRGLVASAGAERRTRDTRSHARPDSQGSGNAVTSGTEFAGFCSARVTHYLPLLCALLDFRVCLQRETNDGPP